jgi:hypothetical protein
MSETTRTIGSPTVVLVHGAALATTFSGEH